MQTRYVKLRGAGGVIAWLLLGLLACALLVPLDAQANRPGDRQPLTGMHPSYDQRSLRPEGFTPRVTGMDFLSDGRLVISTWDGEVYILDGVQGSESTPSVKEIATGLFEPMGLVVVDDDIFVMQKHQLTQLIDHTGDEVIDEYRTIVDGWRITTNYSQWSFGLVYKDGYFYTNLASAMMAGMPDAIQLQDRGSVIRMDPESGTYEVIAEGIRTPNGMGLGVDGEIFITDTQGAWLPANKLIHVQEGKFYGFRAVDPARHADLPEDPPAVWLPQGEIANSPSQPILVADDSPYAGQMLYGDVHHGGIKRVFIEKVDGVYQGAAFRFAQGFEAGVHRMVFGPDLGLYVGGVGESGGNWNHLRRLYGLERLRYNGKTTFEMLAVRALPNGMEIEFTAPLAPGVGEQPSDYYVSQWHYEATAAYGGPKRDLTELPVSSVKVSDDRTRVFLEIPGRKPEHVVYIRLSDNLRSDTGDGLWATEAWYSLVRIPE